MMSEFLNAIVLDPSSDEARLVYGDNLMDNNDPLGELIVVQCRLAVGEGDQRKQVIRQNQLLKALAKEWGAGWRFAQGELEYTERRNHPIYNDDEKMRLRFLRGFIDHVETHRYVFESRLGWLKEMAPLLRSLRLKDYRGRDGPPKDLLATLHELPRLRSLALAPGNRDALQDITTHKKYGTLSELSIEQGFESDSPAEELAMLAASKTLTSLTSLDLYQYGLLGIEIAPLTEATFFLRKLFLNKSELGVRGAELLANNKAFSQLEELGLYNNNLGSAGVAAIANAGHLGALRYLDLRSNRMGIDGAKALGNASGLPRLQSLILVGNSFKAEAIEGLCGPGLSKLSSLNLQHTRLDDDCITALLTNRSFCSQLTFLNLRTNKLTDMSAKAIANCASFSGLQELNLNGNKIGAEGEDALRKSKYLKMTIIYSGGKRIVRN